MSSGIELSLFFLGNHALCDAFIIGASPNGGKQIKWFSFHFYYYCVQGLKDHGLDLMLLSLTEDSAEMAL